MAKPTHRKKNRLSKQIKPTRVSSCKCATAGGLNQTCHGFTGGVSKHGADVLKSAKIAAVYWGSYFTANADVKTTFDLFFTQLFASTYLNSLQQYGVTGATFMGGSALFGGLHPGQGGVESQIQSWLSRGQLPIPSSTADASNWLYVLVPPPGEIVFDNGDETDVNLCGYHGHHKFQFTNSGFGNIVASGCRFFVGSFSAPSNDEILFYSPSDGNWWLGAFAAGQLVWNLAGNTGTPGSGFGNISHDPFYVGDFTGSGQSSLLFYSPGDFNWWLGTFSGNQLVWNQAGNTKGFGQVNDGRPFWVGRFSTVKQSQILFYFPGDGNWWLSSFAGNQLSWSLAGNTGKPGTGFGNISKDPFYLGDFTGTGQTSILFYSPGDFNWWLGTFSGNQLVWNLAGNTIGFGQVDDGRPFWVGRFSAVNQDNILFYFPGDGNWWLGSFAAKQLSWTLAGNTGKPGTGFGNISKDPFYVGDFTGNGHSSLLFYSPGDFNWWLGTFSGNQLAWNLAGNTIGFGQVDDGRPFWVGRFSAVNQDNILFYFPGDGNWWLGTFSRNQLSWSLAGNTGISVNFSADVPYAVVGFPVPGAGSTPVNVVNSIAYCLSHEMVEAMSNPRSNGYYSDKNGCEIGDICEADPKTGNIVTVPVKQWLVEKYWSNNAKGCVSS